MPTVGIYKMENGVVLRSWDMQLRVGTAQASGSPKAKIW